jgi:hypothetical protein
MDIEAEHLIIARELKEFAQIISKLDFYLLSLRDHDEIESGKKRGIKIFSEIGNLVNNIAEARQELMKEYIPLLSLVRTAERDSFSEYSIFVIANAFIKKKDNIWSFYNQLRELMTRFRQLEALIREANPASSSAFKAKVNEAEKLREAADGKFQDLFSKLIDYVNKNKALIRQLNRQISFNLNFASNGRQVNVPVRVIFNSANISELFDLDTTSFMRSASIRNFLKTLDEGNIDSLELRILDIVKEGLREALSQSHDQFDIFASTRIITVVVELLGESSGSVAIKKSTKNGILRINYIRGNDDLRIILDIMFLSDVLKGKQDFSYLVSTIVHELTHIFDRQTTGDIILNDIRMDGLAFLSELAVSQKAEIEKSWLGALESSQEFPPSSDAQLHERLAGNNKYSLGLYMWMSIFIYFAKRRLSWINVHGCFSNPGLMADTILNPEVKRLLNIYLRTFRSVNWKHFADLQQVAAKSLGLKPYYMLI